MPAVLFLCVHNAGRSQMALGWFTHLAGDRAIAWSGGSAPASGLDPGVVAAMAEAGIDITGEFAKPWTGEFVLAADIVITMGCGDASRDVRRQARASPALWSAWRGRIRCGDTDGSTVSS